MKKSVLGLVALLILQIAIPVAAIVGEVKCIIKFIDCDFEPNYKAEWVYGVSTFTGLGCIVGWMDIEDVKKPVGGGK